MMQNKIVDTQGKEGLFLISPEELLTLVELPIEEWRGTKAQKWRFLVTRHFANKIKKGDWQDPLLRQVLPIEEEDEIRAGFKNDAVGDEEAVERAGGGTGILQKYRGRVLVTVGQNCGMRCRFCFRRNCLNKITDQKEEQKLAVRLEKWLRERPEIKEVILSGGDPLMSEKEELIELVEKVLGVETVETIRIHTRLPVVWPERLVELREEIGERVIEAGKKGVLVTHVNHRQELDEASQKVLAEWRKMGWTLLNQSVLLAGVNDSVEAQVELARGLWSQGVLPYYVHQLDKAQGVAHFEVSDERATEIWRGIRVELPGYLVAKLVREVQGEANKTGVL